MIYLNHPRGKEETSMTRAYKVEVFGLNLDGVESFGGWQTYCVCFDLERATEIRNQLVAELGADCVDWNF